MNVTMTLNNLILGLLAGMTLASVATAILLRAWLREGRAAWAETKRWANDVSASLDWTREFPAVTACIPEPTDPEPTGRHGRLILDSTELDAQFDALVADIDLGMEGGRHRKAEVA